MSCFCASPRRRATSYSNKLPRWGTAKLSACAVGRRRFYLAAKNLPSRTQRFMMASLSSSLRKEAADRSTSAIVLTVAVDREDRGQPAVRRSRGRSRGRSRRQRRIIDCRVDARGCMKQFCSQKARILCGVAHMAEGG